MSKRHFEALAVALAAVKPNDTSTFLIEQWILDVRAVADVCEQINPRFDRVRFLEACNQ